MQEKDEDAGETKADCYEVQNAQTGITNLQ